MKFEDAYLGMKVISDGPLKIRGVINTIDDKEKSVRVKGERLNLWFFQNKHTEYDIAYLKKDAKADANIIDCAKRIKEYCTYGNCTNCVLHRNGRCFTQPEVEDNYYNEEPAPIFPIDWDLD